MPQALTIIKNTGILPTAGTGRTLLALFAADPKTAKRVIEFFTANTRNSNTPESLR